MVLIDSSGPDTPIMVPIETLVGGGGSQPSSHRHEKPGFSPFQDFIGQRFLKRPSHIKFSRAMVRCQQGPDPPQ